MIVFEDEYDWQSSGTIKTKIPAGVAVCDGFDSAALWIESTGPVTLSFTDASVLSVDAGLPVDNSLTVAELKSICTQLSLSTSGLKADLLARVQEATS
tara:strand:- start:113 stop:406 length:294 start_codon:yes stop_codon:yes gene_type:complete